MRISDWSLDVCSSDLDGPGLHARDRVAVEPMPGLVGQRHMQRHDVGLRQQPVLVDPGADGLRLLAAAAVQDPRAHRRQNRLHDRKSVRSGKRVTVRLTPVGRRLLQQNKTYQYTML